MFSTNTDCALSLISTFLFKHIAIVARIDKLNTSLDYSEFVSFHMVLQRLGWHNELISWIT
jgi:hypothetical protein